jgi:predicted transcriptional regulator
MSKFDDFFGAVLDGAKTVGGDAPRNFLKQAITDSQAFKLQAEADLQRWSAEVNSGQLDQDDFASLLRGQLSEATLAALLKAGVAQQQAGEMRDKIVNLAIKAAFTILV